MSNHHKFVGSSSLIHCDYDDEKGLLEICFASGGTYHYECEKHEYDALKSAASAGKHFHSKIRSKYKPVS